MKKDTIQYPDFQKLDIRVGEILEAAPVEGSVKLLHFKVNFGEDYGIVEILSGIAEFYKPEDMLHKKFLFVANLEPKKIFGFFSNGMILAVDHLEKPILLEIEKSVSNGTAVR